ncbi:MAG: hypothetical protein OXG49_01330 [Chloroflexi bacterium]|nr:hypothetical protein [Chloroflexota bacterium]
MSDIVIDTNVWVLADRITSISAEIPAIETDCIETCYQWIQQFAASGDRLVVDRSYRIFHEYRNNIRQGGLAEQELNRLESNLLERLVFVDIAFDRDGHAIVPADVMIKDESDRKFIAVAIASEPYAPIYNATETDWTEEQERLSQFGLVVHELCPDYIEQRMLIR